MRGTCSNVVDYEFVSPPSIRSLSAVAKSEKLFNALGVGLVVGCMLCYDLLFVDVVARVLRCEHHVTEARAVINDVARVRHHAFVPDEFGFCRVQAFRDPLC